MTAGQATVIYDVIALSDLNDERYADLREAVSERLASFDCHRSPHLQDFARSKVQSWEAHGHSRTYVLVCPDGAEGVDVPAFFTIGMTSLDLSRAGSSHRKKLNGSHSMSHTGAYTIAELARSDRYSSEQLPGEVILDEAKEIIRQSRVLVAGRFVTVDAQEKVFKALYEPAGFKRLGLAERPPQDMDDVEFITAVAIIKNW